MGRLLKTEAILLLVLTLLGAGLRLYNLGGQGIWDDEMFTLMAAKGQGIAYYNKYRSGEMDVKAFREDIMKPTTVRPAGVVKSVYGYDTHPPLYYMVVNLFQSVLGVSAFAVRLPSVLFSVLTIPFLFLLGKRLHSTALGLVAAGLFAFAPYQVYYAQEARMYSMVVFLAVVSTWLLVDLSLRRQEGGRWDGWGLWGGYILVTTAGFYTQFIFVFILAAQFLFVAARHLRDRVFLARWSLALGLSLLAFLPWLIPLFFRDKVPPSIGWLFEGKWSIPKLIMAARDSMLTFVWSREVPPYKMKWLLWILIFVGLWAARRRTSLWLLPLWVISQVAAIVFIDILLGTHASRISRYLIVSSPGLCLLLAFGIVTLRPRFFSHVLVGALFVYLAFGSYWTAEGRIPRNSEFWRVGHQIKEAGQKIASTSKPEDLVVLVSNNPRGTAMVLAYHMEHPWRIIRVRAENIMQVDWASLSERLRGHDQVIFVVTDLNVEYPPEFERSVKEGLPYLKFAGDESYKRLHLFRFREVI
jgi:uncharacterized membrane protein